MNNFIDKEITFPEGSILEKAYKLWVKSGKPTFSQIIESGCDPYSDFINIAQENNAEDLEEYVFDITFELLCNLDLLDEDGCDIRNRT